MPPSNTPLLTTINQRLSAIESSLTRRENMVSFLVIRFVLMSGMVLGFSWTFLQLNP